MRGKRNRNALLRYRKDLQRNFLAEPGVNPFIVVLDGLKAGYNVAKIFRSAEAFGAREVHLVQIGPFDPAAAKGSFRKVPVRFHPSFGECCQGLKERGYTLLMLEPGCGNVLFRTELPEKSAFIFGNEEFGMSFNRLDYPEVIPLGIPQFGKVQSLNVAVAASIVMYEYVRQKMG